MWQFLGFVQGNQFQSIFSLLWKILLFVIVILLAASYFLADSLLFKDNAPTYSKAYPYFSISDGRGGEIVCRFIGVPRSSYLIIYSHGNAEDLGIVEPTLQKLARAGFSVIGYDYPGYGHSTGKAGQESVNRAIQAVHQYVTDVLGFQDDQLILYGRSLGSGPTVNLAEAIDAHGVILEGAFKSAFSVVAGISFLPWDKYPNIRKIDDLDDPLLILHGTEDQVVPYDHGVSLFEKANGYKLYYWVEGAGHNNLVDYLGDDYQAVIRDFARFAQRSYSS